MLLKRSLTYCSLVFSFLCFMTKHVDASEMLDENIETDSINIIESVEDNSKTVIRLGGFYSNSNSHMQVTDPFYGEKFELDFEEDLKLEESQFLPFLELYYHFNDHHIIFFDWKRLHRSAEITKLAKPFEFPADSGNYFKAGAKLNTTLNFDILRVGYGYNFYQGDNYNLGFSAGLHTMFIETGFNGTIGGCAEDVPTDECNIIDVPKIVDKKITAPLPDLGLYGYYEFYDGFKFVSHAQYFYVELGDLNLKGQLIDIRAGVEAKITENWSMTAAFNFYEVDVDYAKYGDILDNKVADFNLYYSFIGPMLSVSYRF